MSEKPKICSSYLAKSILLSIYFILINSSSILQQNCIKQPVPQKFAILTLTYIRNRSTEMLLRYLSQYATSDCPLYDNIYIVWNNRQNPQQMNVLVNKQNWKKNVYILQTVVNSMDFKYMIPPWAPQTVFFDMDDDFEVSCQSMKIGFQRYKASSYGQLGPITSFYGRSFDFEPQTQSFIYFDQVKMNPKWSYFHMSLTGLAFISRHFLELYYSDIQEIKQMRKKVVLTNNCDDILLNFMISHYYPQLRNQYVETQFVSLGQTGISSNSKHKKIRGQCMAQFSQILGYNPLRYLKTNVKQENKMKIVDPNSCLVGLKKQHYQKKFINNKSYYLNIKRVVGINNGRKSLIDVVEQNKNLIEAKQNIQEFIKTHNFKEGQNKYNKQQINGYKEVQQVADEMNMHFSNKMIKKQQLLNLKANDSMLQQKHKRLFGQGSKNQQIEFQKVIKKSQSIRQPKQNLQTSQLVSTQLTIQRYIVLCVIILISSATIIILTKNIFHKRKTSKQYRQVNMVV